MGRTKTKTYAQPDENSCGPAALKNALNIIGLRSSFKELCRLCKNTKNGTSVANLIKAANNQGASVMTVEWATLRHIQRILKAKSGQPLAGIVDYLYMDGEPHEDTGHYAAISSYSARNSRLILFDSYSGTKKSYLWTDFQENWFDYDNKRITSKHAIRRGQLYKRWHNRLLVILARDEQHLPKFTTPTAKIYPA